MSFREATYQWLVTHHPLVREEHERRMHLEARDPLLTAVALVAAHDRITAEAEAGWVFKRAYDMAEIIGLYQRTVKTLYAADPHEARVRMVVTNFFADFKDKYELGSEQ